jgi:hypothetical protein
MPERRAPWLLTLALIIAAGIGSRLIHTGWILLDKYLGDALYAAMIYVICRLFTNANRAALSAVILMTAIETFQLTLIPAHLAQSANLTTRIVARLMGTYFSWLDLVAYYIAIAVMFVIDRITKKN